MKDRMTNRTNEAMPIRSLAALALALSWSCALLAQSEPARAAETGSGAYTGAAVTVIKPQRRCFADTIAVSGTLVPREEVLVRPDREGLQISQVMADPGQSITSGETLARLIPLDASQGGAVSLPSPVAGIVLKSNAVIGTTASVRAPPMFQIIARGEFELQGELPAALLSKLAAGQNATISTVGAADVSGKVRLVAATVDGATQLGQVRVFIGVDERLRVGAFGRALIVTAESCRLAVPLSAVLYSTDNAVVAVVRNDRVETRQIVTGLMAEGAVEIREGLSESDLIVAKAGAFFREGDRVRPFLDGKPAR